MKKLFAIILALILSISMLTACRGGGDSGNGSDSAGGTPALTDSGDSGWENNANTSAQQTAEIIKSSELITQEDAARILGENVKINALDERSHRVAPGSVETRYGSTESSLELSISLYQNAAFDINDKAHKKLLDQGGIASANDSLRKEHERRKDAVSAEGLGDWAFITPTDNETYLTIVIGYGDYRIVVDTRGEPHGGKPADKGMLAMRTEILTEAGKLALERLAAIIN